MNTMMIAGFLFFAGIVVFTSWYRLDSARVNTLSNLFFANRSLGFVLVGSGLLFTNINAASIIGENELAYTNNMTVMAWGVSSVLAMLLVSEFIMPLYLKMGIATTPDFLTARYGADVGRLVSVIFLISYIFNLLPSVLYAGAVAFNGLFHFSDVWGISYPTVIVVLVWIMGTIGCIVSIIGGLKAITKLDILLGIGFFCGGILLPFFGLKYIGHGNVGDGLQQLLIKHTGHLNGIGSSHDAIPFGTLFTGMLLVNLYYWGTEQYIIQQVLSSKDLETSQKGIALACLGKLASPLLLNIPGIIAVHVFANMTNTAEAFPRLVSMVSPPFIAGFISAIIFVASLTTFNAGLNSSSTLFMLNIYKPWLQKRSKTVTERKLVRTAKQFEIMICLAAMFIAPLIIFVKNGFYTYVQIVNGFFNVPIFTIMFMGFVTKKVPGIAAKIGLGFFITCYALTQLVVNTHIHFLHILAILFVLTCGLMLLIGKLYPMPVAYTLKLNNLVDIRPWENRYYYAGMLLILMIALFVLFSPLILAK
jgi:SSS family solute:Na+ symporter